MSKFHTELVERINRFSRFFLRSNWVNMLPRSQPSCPETCSLSVVVLKTGELQEFRVVSRAQSSAKLDEGSSWAPLGKALLGRRVGESVYVKTPSGTVRYQILKISEEE